MPNDIYPSLAVTSRVTGSPASEAPRLLLLHGFTQTAESWRYLLPGLNALGSTIAVDLVGHGKRPPPRDFRHYSMEAAVEQLAKVVAETAGGPVWPVGYSMGGRTALHFSLKHPELVRGLVLISATAGLGDAREREARILADEALAERLEKKGVDLFLRFWMDLPLFSGLAALPPEQREFLFESRRVNSALGLANSLRGMGTGAMTPVWDKLGELQKPVLLLAGEQDTKFATLAREMADALPQATCVILPECGHACHLEAMPETLAAIGEFIRQ